MKHISSLLSQILPNQNSPFTNRLMNSSLMQNTPAILMTDILYLIECFEGFGPECNGIYLTGAEYLSQFFKAVTTRPLLGYISVKLSLTMHLILYEFQIGEMVAEQMMREGQQLRVPSGQSHGQFVVNYQMYLMKLAQSLKVFYACKIGQYPILDQEPSTQESTREQLLMRKQLNIETNLQLRTYQQKQLERQMVFQNHSYITQEQKILYLFKLHNLLNQCTQILNLTLAVLNSQEKNDSRSIYIEIGCVLWNDAMVMYKFSTSELCKLLDSFRALPLQQIQSIQQIYFSTLSSTKSLQWVFKNKRVFDVQNIVKQPFWFEENTQLASSLNDAIIDNKMQFPETTRHLRQGTPKAIQMPQSSRMQSQINQPFFITNKKSTTLTPQPQDQRRGKYSNAVGSLFQDEQFQMSPRDYSHNNKFSPKQKQ